ncbi:MAG: hypothetical protein ACQESK_06910 [Bacteroidota bacterium]
MKNLIRVPFAMFLASLVFLSCSTDDSDLTHLNESSEKMNNNSFTINYGELNYRPNQDLIEFYSDSDYQEKFRV